MNKEFKVEGMSCNHCVMAVQKNLAKLNPKGFKVEIGSVKVEFDENKLNEELIIKAIENAGFTVIK